MGEGISSRTKAILEALLVTFLWSSSYIFTKFGLIDIQPLTLVGLRYLIASIVLVPIALSRGEHKKIKGDAWWKLAVLGFLGYTVAQGLQCVGLSYLPAVMVTLILNFTPLVVMILNVLFTGEYPNRDQIAGMVLVLTGAVLFFSDRLEGGTLTGVLITFVSGLGWAGYMVAGKLLFKEKRVSPLGNTAFAMGFGSALISASALLFEGLAPIPLTGWAIIIWLGVVNTAAAFFMWNHALETIDSFELSILQNTMLIQTTILSMIFLGERLPAIKYVYMALVFIGVYVVQTRGGDKN
jgi:drug/metabolite transporter (DMT)-like permease